MSLFLEGAQTRSVLFPERIDDYITEDNTVSVLTNSQLDCDSLLNINITSTACKVSMNVKSLKNQARKLKQQTLTVYFAARDPDTPIIVRFLAILVSAYALSPIDLIPDFIPIIGYIDELVIIPLGLALIVRLTPQRIIESSQLKARQVAHKPVSYTAAAIFIFIWIIVFYIVTRWLFATYGNL